MTHVAGDSAGTWMYDNSLESYRDAHDGLAAGTKCANWPNCMCRYRPLKPSCGTVQQDLLSKLQRFDFALNDADNNGCR